MRERTYWPKLCLVQVAGPEEAAAIDALAEGIDLAAARRADGQSQGAQGLSRRAPGPGNLLSAHEQRADAAVRHPGRRDGLRLRRAASYETLATKLAKAQIDKSSRFTDWSRRPLSERQITYALSDVTHLRVVYEKLRRQLERSGRLGWIAEEMEVLNDPRPIAPTRRGLAPPEAARRLAPAAPRPEGGRRLARAHAQRIDMPRQRLLRDEQLLEIASHAPKTDRGAGA